MLRVGAESWVEIAKKELNDDLKSLNSRHRELQSKLDAVRAMLFGVHYHVTRLVQVALAWEGPKLARRGKIEKMLGDIEKDAKVKRKILKHLEDS